MRLRPYAKPKVIRVLVQEAQCHEPVHARAAGLAVFAEDLRHLRMFQGTVFLNHKQCKQINLLQLAAQRSERRFEWLANFQRLAFDSFNRAKPEFECGTKNAGGLLIERVKEELLWG